MPASTTSTKTQILENAGYAYSFDRMVYVNREARKVFSTEFVQDHGETELEARINERPPDNHEWRFYFNADPPEAVKRELAAILE
jgi:hypothetical protein